MLKIYRIAGTAALAALFIARAALAVDETPKRPQTSAPVSSSLLSVHESDVTFSNYKFRTGCGWFAPGAVAFARFNDAVHLIVGQGFQGFVTSLTGVLTS